MQNHEKQQNLAKIPMDRYILLVDNRNERRMLKIVDQKGFRWRKIPISLKPLCNFEYYQKLEVLNGDIRKSQASDYSDEQEDVNQCQQDNDEQQNCVNKKKGFGDNRDIFTLQEAQKLQPEQIQAMKKQKKGQEIISAIVINNEQFQKRTAYSKQKYLKKKQKKYLFHFHVEPVCPQSLHTYYYLSSPKSIGSIRWDIFGFILLQAAPFISKDILIMEKTKGLFMGTSLYKGAQSVTILNDQELSQKHIRKNYPIIQDLNLSQQQKNKIKVAKLSKLSENSFDCLFCVGNYNFAEIIQQLNKYLKLGAPICLYCEYLEPLSECFDKMMSMKYINVRIYDGWMRQYQVLKNRTHPMMYMDSQSGYLLSAIKSEFNKVQIKER